MRSSGPFWRRRFPRPRFGAAPPPPAVEKLPPILLEANRLFAEGQYLQAAQLFERLAHGAETRQVLRAPHLWAQAGRARIYAAQVEAGMANVQRALQLLAQQGRWVLLEQLSRRAVDELNRLGFEAQARQVQSWQQAMLPSSPAQAAPAVDAAQPAVQEETPKPPLPTVCPACGAQVHPQEVEWVDEMTAECSFCGTLLRGAQ
ncbi:MAG: hypothetical protein HPY45_13935 [Anaerolineae bacterium]|nr:hypothetical protein [Anaerolineae bacterium]